jgi:hypothetical protein
MRLQSVVVLACMTGTNTAAADSMRCGKWVVDETATVKELLEKCGAPADKQVTTEDVMATNANGFHYKVGTTVAEHWTYRPSRQSLPMVVNIVDGKIISIERADGR